MKALKAAAFMTLASATLIAQDAITTLPDNDKLQFENAWVKVTRVHYPAHAKFRRMFLDDRSSKRS